MKIRILKLSHTRNTSKYR